MKREVIALDDVDGSGVEEEKSVSEDATLSSLDINAEQTEAQKIQIHRLWLTGGFKKRNLLPQKEMNLVSKSS